MITKHRIHRERVRIAKHYVAAKPSTPPTGAAKSSYRTLTDTPIVLITNRAKATLHSRKVKPSMPKMPWEPTS